jgi:Flp pilus assembly protein TadD
MKTSVSNAWRMALGLLSMTLLAAGCTSTGNGREPAWELPPLRENAIAAGDEAVQRGDYRAALMLYTQAHDGTPNPDLWLRIAAAHLGHGNPDGAFDAYARVLQSHADHLPALEALGLLYLRQRDPEQASIYLEQAAATGEAGWQTHNGLGVLADIAGHHAGALGHYRHALTMRPGSLVVQNNIGYSHFLAGDLDQAERMFERLLERHAYAPTTMNLALVHARRGEYRRAVAQLSSVLATAAAHNDIGFIAMVNADFEAAEWLFREAIRQSPVHYETAQKNLALNRTLAAEHGDGVRSEVPRALLGDARSESLLLE